MRVGIESRQHGEERIVVAFGEPLQRREPDERHRIAQKVDERVHADRGGGVSQSQQRLGTNRRIEASRVEQLGQRWFSARIANAGHGTNRFERGSARRTGCVDVRQQHWHS
jgi:hypothetical protein